MSLPMAQMLPWVRTELQTFLATVGCVSILVVILVVLCHPEAHAVIAQHREGTAQSSHGLLAYTATL